MSVSNEAYLITRDAKVREIEALKGHIAVLLNQLALFPVKHPQQTAQREAAKAAIAD